MATLIGTEGRDVLRGTAGADVIDGLGGNDLIFSGGAESGFDNIHGGNGNDRIFLDRGEVAFSAGPGDDYIISFASFSGSGDSGNDFVLGLGNFSDLILGDGDDVFIGGSGIAWATGDAGNDRLTGGSANDSLSGGAGNDVLSGGAGDDQLTDDDRVVPGPQSFGDDVLVGGPGNDNLSVLGGNDRLEGGPGSDHFYFALHVEPHDRDVIGDFTKGEDTLVFLFNEESPFQNFGDFDTNNNGILDNGDEYVSVGRSTTIDTSSAFGDAPFTDTITLTGVSGLTEDHLLFIA